MDPSPLSPDGHEAVPADPVAIADALRVSATRLARILRRQDPEALPPTLSSALKSIDCEGPLSLGDLAAREHVAPPTITRVVEKLKAQGFVACRQGAEDRRVSLVEVTAEGHQYLSRSRTLRTAWLAGLLKELPPEDLARLGAAAPVLERLVQATHHPDRADRAAGAPEGAAR